MSVGFRLGVVLGFGLLGSCQGGMGRVSGVTRDCSFSNWVCSVSNMVWGCEVISPVLGSVMLDRFGWSLAYGCRPDAIFRMWWYLLGLFLYSASSFFFKESMSFLLALLRMVVMSLLQSVGISGTNGGLSSFRTSVAIVGSVVYAACRFEVVSWDLLTRWWLFMRFFRRVMRLICRLSELLIGVCNLV